MNPNEGYYDVLTNVVRNVDTTRDQWLDPGRSSRVWPDPPINGRALTLEAFMGVSSGDSWTMTPFDFLVFGLTFAVGAMLPSSTSTRFMSADRTTPISIDMMPLLSPDRPEQYVW